MNLEFEYGNGMMRAELPDTTDVFIPGETVPDPPCLPQDWDSLYAATLESIRHPIGMEPLRELAEGKSRVLIISSDHTRPVPSRITMPLLLSEIREGNPRAEITILIATGMHRPTTAEEILNNVQGQAKFISTEGLSALKAKLDAGERPRILALSTCSDEFTDARTVLLTLID